MERTARLGAKGDVCLERFAATKNISYSTRRALRSNEGRNSFFETNMAYAVNSVDAHCVAFAVPDFGGSLEKEPGPFSGRENNVHVAGLCCGVR